MTTETELIAALAAINAPGQQADVASVVAGVDEYVFDHAAFPDPLFARLLAVIQSPQFQARTDTAAFLKIFEYNLGLLTTEQRERFATVLAGVIAQLADPTSAFLAVELIAEAWGDQRSFDVFAGLLKSSSEETVALGVHGLDWLAKKSSQSKLQDSCLEKLRSLDEHPSALVRAEAAAALVRRTQQRGA